MTRRPGRRDILHVRVMVIIPNPTQWQLMKTLELLICYSKLSLLKQRYCPAHFDPISLYSADVSPSSIWKLAQKDNAYKRIN